MADLTGLIPVNSVIELIDTMYGAAYKPRTWLGLSEIGGECNRALWYTHNGYEREQPGPRILRLFELGNVIEDVVVKDLENAGFKIHSQQKEVKIDEFVGHIDGIIEGLKESSVPHLLEIKSSNDKQFSRLKNTRNYSEWNPKYGMQVQVYMIGLKLQRCLVVVYNKNTSELYTERISVNKAETVGILADKISAINGSSQPARLCPGPSWYKAKWCPFHEECFK